MTIRMLSVASFLATALCLAIWPANGLGKAQAQEVAATPSPPADPQVERGRYLATVGNCVSCHTRKGGAPFSGGLAFETPFGTIYSTNITPDPTTGIGAWTLEQFKRAMREGVDANGENLYPAFPYTAFTKINDEDLGAIYAYIKSLAPVQYTAPENAMGFPFNQRALMGVWNALFFDNARFTPAAAQLAEWNRGAYLVEGLGHCGACHTPRNVLGAEQSDKSLAGGTYLDAVEEGKNRPWSAVNLTQSTSGLAAWTADDIATYLKTGHGARAGTFGPMNEVIVNSTQNLTDADVRAMAVYLKSLPPIETSAQTSVNDKDLRAGETVYTIHCGTCHLPTGLGATLGSELGPSLVGSAVVQAPDPATLINVILYGAHPPVPSPTPAWKNMKSFGNELDDDEVVLLVNYLRASWGNKGSAVNAAQVAKQR